MPKIEEDKYFKCVEFYKFRDNIKLGFILYKTNQSGFVKRGYQTIYLDKNHYNKKYQYEDIFDSLKILKEYNFMFSQLKNDNSSIQTKKLKRLYNLKPVFTLKRHINPVKNQWIFLNIFNEYFCFCKRTYFLNLMISKICKYYLYLHLIDKNHEIYKKTDFLLMDFIFKNYSSDDVYPIFEKMINRNLSAHYLTERKDIYKRHCDKIRFCDFVYQVDGITYKINGEFFERHFNLILKLKQVFTSAGVNIDFINNNFYNIDYIDYICVGHGVSYFKYYLYEDYYGPNNFDKLLIPNSHKLISVPLKYGWKEENLIKFDLPRWEKYNNLNNYFKSKININSNSIFIMFTWREIKPDKNVSLSYFNNIIKLLKNELLIKSTNKYNITLYYSIHHQVIKYKDKFKKIKELKHLKYIEENDISECLLKTNLVVTDYSSIIFDMIYRRKPYIIYIPDINDMSIYQNYEEKSYNIIKKFRLNDFHFENVFFDINSTINEIVNYIHNNFKLNIKLKKFYDDFNFKNGSIIDELIDYTLKITSGA